MLGEPTGVAAKWYLKDDYVLHPYLLHARESYMLPVYVGVGVRLADSAATTSVARSCSAT